MTIPERTRALIAGQHRRKGPAPSWRRVILHFTKPWTVDGYPNMDARIHFWSPPSVHDVPFLYRVLEDPQQEIETIAEYIIPINLSRRDYMSLRNLYTAHYVGRFNPREAQRMYLRLVNAYGVDPFWAQQEIIGGLPFMRSGREMNVSPISGRPIRKDGAVFDRLKDEIFLLEEEPLKLPWTETELNGKPEGRKRWHCVIDYLKSRYPEYKKDIMTRWSKRDRKKMSVTKIMEFCKDHKITYRIWNIFGISMFHWQARGRHNATLRFIFHRNHLYPVKSRRPMLPESVSEVCKTGSDWVDFKRNGYIVTDKTYKLRDKKEWDLGCKDLFLDKHKSFFRKEIRMDIYNAIRAPGGYYLNTGKAWELDHKKAWWHMFHKLSGRTIPVFSCMDYWGEYTGKGRAQHHLYMLKDPHPYYHSNIVMGRMADGLEVTHVLKPTVTFPWNQLIWAIKRWNRKKGTIKIKKEKKNINNYIGTWMKTTFMDKITVPVIGKERELLLCTENVFEDYGGKLKLIRSAKVLAWTWIMLHYMIIEQMWYEINQILKMNPDNPVVGFKTDAIFFAKKPVYKGLWHEPVLVEKEFRVARHHMTFKVPAFKKTSCISYLGTGGTGKTTLALDKGFEQGIAYTRRASRRLKGTKKVTFKEDDGTQEVMAQVRGKTIHSEFGIKCKKPRTPGTKKYFVDEISMIPYYLWNYLYHAFERGSTVILGGDHRQVGPIEGPGFWESPSLMQFLGNVTVLTKNYRCSDMLLAEAEKAWEGKPLSIPFGESYPKLNICYTNECRLSMNTFLFKHYGHQDMFEDGVRLIAHRSAGEIENGDMFIVRGGRLKRYGEDEVIDIPEEDILELAYCITVYKVQGDTIDEDIGLMEWELFDRRMKWTALTRGRAFGQYTFVNYFYDGDSPVSDIASMYEEITA